jgi:hypothetical protein
MNEDKFLEWLRLLNDASADTSNIIKTKDTDLYYISSRVLLNQNIIMNSLSLILSELKQWQRSGQKNQ